LNPDIFKYYSTLESTCNLGQEALSMRELLTLMYDLNPEQNLGRVKW